MDSSKTVAILGFHKIGEPPAGTWSTWNYIGRDTFLGYLDLVVEGGFQIVDLETFLAGLEDPSLLPERAALLTFDDGFQSMSTVALPCLKHHGFPAVLFVPTDFIGATNTFDQGNEPVEPICSWEELQDLEECGVSIQSHGASHQTFSELSVPKLEAEISKSKAVLEENLGSRVTVFAFPFGDRGTNTATTERLLQEAGYGAACLYGGGLLQLPGQDLPPFRLPRLALGPDTDLEAMLSGVP